MVRTQIQLEDSQYKRLKSMAMRHSTSLSQLVREGVERLLEEDQQPDCWQRLWKVVGTCHDSSGAIDVAENHDRYLSDIYSGDQS